MLSSQLQNAHVIIHRLEQPHRFDYAAHCACGFQHHGFASPAHKGGEVADMVDFAAQHLTAKHAIPAAKVNDFIEVAPFTHSGGLGHFMLKQMLAVRKENDAKAAKEAKPTAPTQPAAPTQTAASAAVQKLSQVQSGEVKK